MDKTIWKIVWIVVAVLIVGGSIWVAWANKSLQLNTYAVSSSRLPDAFEGFRIAHVSDLHNDKMGKDNKKLLFLLRQAQPDIIAITGDMIDSHRTKPEIALAFAEEAVKIAPCYYVPGNHESRLAEYPAFRDELSALGVTVLENRTIAFSKNGQQITIAGVKDPAFDPLTDNDAIMTAQLQSLALDPNAFTLLLSHRPELLDVYTDSGADLVLSGHAHGGQVRLPLIGGVIAPHQGFFPEYDSGLYTQGNTAMIVSRGIGNSISPPRINNRPEVLLVTLQQA